MWRRKNVKGFVKICSVIEQGLNDPKYYNDNQLDHIDTPSIRKWYTPK